MALARSRRSESGLNYWPGFVDALSTLVLSIVFLLTVFLVVQFFLSQEVTGKDKALEQLNAKIAQLNDLLSLEKLAKLNLDDQVAQLKAGLAPQVTIESDNAGRTAMLAAERGYRVVKENDRVVASLRAGDDPRVASAGLNRALNEAGIAVFSIGPSARTLEGIYRDVSGGAAQEAA